MTDQAIPLFFNPTAGRGRARRLVPAISSILDANGISHNPVASREPGDIEALVVSAIDEGHRQLLIAGGDGSVHEAVNGILRSGVDVEFGVIPIGTGNDFAKASSIPLYWEDAATLLADRMCGGSKGRQIDAGRCNDRYFANGAGIGFDARISRIAQSIRLPIGDFVYLLAVFRGLWGIRRFRFKEWARGGERTVEGAACYADHAFFPKREWTLHRKPAESTGRCCSRGWWTENRADLLS